MMNIQEIYQTHFDQIYRFVFRLLGHPQLAEDLTQETFMRLVQFSNANYEIDNPQAWLYRVAGNLCKNNIKRKKIFHPMESIKNILNIKSGDAVEQAFIESEQARLLRRVISKLAARDQLLLQLYQDNLSYREISEITGIKLTSVGKLVSRAIERCARQIEKEEL